MIPPNEINVLDSSGGFTAITTSMQYEKQLDPCRRLESWKRVARENDTLWRPGQLLKGNVTGKLQEFYEDSFFQNNNNVTKAIYKVKGYRFRVAVWFDNVTGARIA